jgi:hypothetical protein
MRFRVRTLTILVAVSMAWLGTSACNSVARSKINTTGQESASERQSAVLINMPMNSNQRCTGIATVAEALLHVEPSPGEGCDMPEAVGQAIFERVMTGSPLRYRPTVLIDGKPLAIESQAAQDRISSVVADLFKKRYAELITTEAGKHRLREGNQFLRTTSELDEILDQAQDKTDVFAGRGMRYFDDGRETETNHAFLIRASSPGAKVVYDSNDPGRPIPCQLKENWGRFRNRMDLPLSRNGPNHDTVVPADWQVPRFAARISNRLGASLSSLNSAAHLRFRDPRRAVIDVAA